MAANGSGADYARPMWMRMRMWTVLTASLAVVACAGDDGDVPGNVAGTRDAGGMPDAGGRSDATAGTGGGPGGSGGAAQDAGALDASPIGGGQVLTRLSITKKAVPAEAEDHVCVTLPLGNERTLWVTSIHATLTQGSHHLIVERRPTGTATSAEVSPCGPSIGADATRLIVAQQRDTTLAMPEGTALRIDPHQPIYMQLHYINLKEEPADIEGVVEFEFADESQGAPIEVKSTFNGSFNIDLPKHSTGASEYFLKPPGTKERPSHVFALTSHTHSLGVESTIERVLALDAPDTTPIHRSLDWHEPPLTTFDPVLDFDGSDGLRLRCNYVNDTDVDVRFGTRFEDEMCFMWLYFYEDPQQ